MTINELTHLVVGILAANYKSVHSKYDVRDVKRLVSQAYNDVVGESFTNKGGVWEIDSGYVKPYYNVAIKDDAARNLRYVELPASPLQLTDDRGIRQVSPMQDENFHFIRRRVGGNFVYSMLESNDYLKGIGQKIYWQEGDKLFFSKEDLPWYYDEHGLLIKLITDASKLSDTDELKVPQPGGETRIMEYTMKLMGITHNMTADRTNDQNTQT